MLRNKPKYWWTSEIAEEWRKANFARRQFANRKRYLLRRGGDYLVIMSDSILLSYKAEWRTARARVGRAIWSSKNNFWKGLLRKVDSDPWGSSVLPGNK